MKQIDTYEVPIMADLFSQGKRPEYLFWVGCAGAFDARYKKVTVAFAKLLLHAEVDFAILGSEETCNGDPARRAGNEMLFQMQALRVIEILNMYNISKILTCCPHCFNIFKNEYPDLGGHYEVTHHSVFLQDLLEKGTLRINRGILNGKSIVYHDPCYLGRGNDIYEPARQINNALTETIREMPRNRSNALCCGAGGAQMFKEAEPGKKEVYIERTEEAIKTEADIVSTACPFCMTMITDGIKYKNMEETIKNYDIAELMLMSLEK